jgi:NAD(P)-dependent dehydrogenase (short-subunit alcohol dehydrogenase family)
VAVYNAGLRIGKPIAEMTAEDYETCWRLGALGGFHTGREAARRMTERGEGTILFTGATASLRGGSGSAAFAGAKFALRALAQSLARELGPKGIHVAHVIIDGIINTPRARSRFPDRPLDAMLDPDAIAEAYYGLHAQPKNAWTFELDLRPFNESF